MMALWMVTRWRMKSSAAISLQFQEELGHNGHRQQAASWKLKEEERRQGPVGKRSRGSSAAAALLTPGAAHPASPSALPGPLASPPTWLRR